ncbi:hypothetical protein BKA81DRAFT_345282 [Phyllosticta paracitricarpa]
MAALQRFNVRTLLSFWYHVSGVLSRQSLCRVTVAIIDEEKRHRLGLLYSFGNRFAIHLPCDSAWCMITFHWLLD